MTGCFSAANIGSKPEDDGSGSDGGSGSAAASDSNGPTGDDGPPTGGSDGFTSSPPDPTDTDPGSTESDTASPHEVCEGGDVVATFDVDAGTLPLTPQAATGNGARYLSALAECTIDPSSTANAIVLTCVGSDDDQHTVSIALDAAVTVTPSVEADAVVTLTYLSDGVDTITCRTGEDASPAIWFELRDDAGDLMLGGAKNGWARQYSDPQLEWFAPFTVTITDQCAGTGHGNGCSERPLSLSIDGEVLRVGEALDVDGVNFALGSGSVMYIEPDHFCCAEAREIELELLVVGQPGA